MFTHTIDIFFEMYDCDSASCTNCSDVTELVWHGPKDEFESTVLLPYVEQCFLYVSKTGGNNQTETSSMIDPGKTNAYSKYVDPTVEEYVAYWKVYLEHTCMGEFVGYDGAEEEDDHENEDDHHEDEDEKKWVGDLTYNMYGPGGCSDENIVGNGTTTELVATEDGGLCETDIIQGATFYTKFDPVSCGDDENPDKIFITVYDCDSSTCTNCSETPELLGYGPTEDFDPESLITNIDHCFSWTTTGGDTNQSVMSQMASTGVGEVTYQQFIPPSTLDDTSGYWKVFLLNSCMGDFLGYTLGDEIEDTEEDGHDADHDHGEDMSNDEVGVKSEASNMSSVKLSAAIMIVFSVSGFMF